MNVEIICQGFTHFENCAEEVLQALYLLRHASSSLPPLPSALKSPSICAALTIPLIRTATSFLQVHAEV